MIYFYILTLQNVYEYIRGEILFYHNACWNSTPSGKIIKFKEFDAELFVRFISDRKCMEFTIVGRGYVQNEGRKNNGLAF